MASNCYEIVTTLTLGLSLFPFVYLGFLGDRLEFRFTIDDKKSVHRGVQRCVLRPRYQGPNVHRLHTCDLVKVLYLFRWFEPGAEAHVTRDVLASVEITSLIILAGTEARSAVGDTFNRGQIPVPLTIRTIEQRLGEPTSKTNRTLLFLDPPA